MKRSDWWGRKSFGPYSLVIQLGSSLENKNGDNSKLYRLAFWLFEKIFFCDLVRNLLRPLAVKKNIKEAGPASRETQCKQDNLQFLLPIFSFSFLPNPLLHISTNTLKLSTKRALAILYIERCRQVIIRCIPKIEFGSWFETPLESSIEIGCSICSVLDKGG